MGHLFMPISFQAFTKPSGSSFANCTKVLVKLLIASKFAAEICVWNPPRCEEISSAWVFTAHPALTAKALTWLSDSIVGAMKHQGNKKWCPRRLNCGQKVFQPHRGDDFRSAQITPSVKCWRFWMRYCGKSGHAARNKAARLGKDGEKGQSAWKRIRKSEERRESGRGCRTFKKLSEKMSESRIALESSDSRHKGWKLLPGQSQRMSGCFCKI